MIDMSRIQSWSQRASVGGSDAPPIDANHNEKLGRRVRELLEAQADALPFHNWPHTDFVRTKAVEFAGERGADVAVVEAAALVHDLNYLVEPNSPPSAGRELRREMLELCGFAADVIERIEHIIDGAHMEHRRKKVDLETACLSDADTLYKALPITPVLYAHLYLAENGIALDELARKIVDEQVHKLDRKYYFYDRTLRKRYRPWAEANLGLWKEIDKALKDPAVATLAAQAPSS
jgi:uncharacterized protein